MIILKTKSDLSSHMVDENNNYVLIEYDSYEDEYNFWKLITVPLEGSELATRDIHIGIPIFGCNGVLGIDKVHKSFIDLLKECINDIKNSEDNDTIQYKAIYVFEDDSSYTTWLNLVKHNIVKPEN